MNEEILKRIDLLAAKLDTTAAHLWSVLIRQAHIAAIEDAIVLALTIAAWIAVYRWGKYLFDHDDRYGPRVEWMGVILGTIAAAISTIICIQSIPTELFNPEYYALHEILTAIK